MAFKIRCALAYCCTTNTIISISQIPYWGHRANENQRGRSCFYGKAWVLSILVVGASHLYRTIMPETIYSRLKHIHIASIRGLFWRRQLWKQVQWSHQILCDSLIGHLRVVENMQALNFPLTIGLWGEVHNH